MNARASEGGLEGRASAGSRGRSLGAAFRRRLRALFISGRLPALLGGLGLGIVLYGLLFSPDYDIRGVQVEGASTGEPARIVDEAALLDRSIFRVDPQAAADRIAALSYVESVEVSIHFPATARVQLVERTPAAVWEFEGESYLVDESGVLMAPLDAGQDDGLPIIQSEDSDPGLGEQVTSEAVALAAAVATSEAGEEVGWFVWDPASGLTAKLTDNRRVLLGVPENPGLTVAVLEELLAEIDDDWQTLDLTVPERPAYR
ncbi:MAG: cell division protein FtsQ/DivIB [Chloroflexota bacterium]